jgi:hypothetical protein
VTQRPLRSVLARLGHSDDTPLEDFPATLGKRKVRVIELLGEYALIQGVNDPRSWEIAPTELITVDPRDVEARRPT